jgi:ATP-dependent DNA helicase RecG
MTNLKDQLKTTNKYISILENNGIKDTKDLLQYFPRTYEDRSFIQPLSQLNINEKWVATTKGKILEKKFSPRKGRKVYECSFVDEQGEQWQINIFNSGYLASKIKEDQRYIIIGRPFFKGGKTFFNQPEIIASSDTTQEQTNIPNIGRIYPIYPELYWIRSAWFTEKIWTIIDNIDSLFEEHLPEDISQKIQSYMSKRNY